MANEALAQILREMAFLLELEGANPFKIRALDNSARLLEDQEKEAHELIAQGLIDKITGVGKGTQAIAKEFVDSGLVKEHEELKKKFPATIFEPLEVAGLGPKKAKALYEQLGIASLTELEYACRENRLIELKGFGEKTQTNILKGIEQVKAGRGKMILPAALQEAENLLEEFRAWPALEQAEISGDLRRRMEIVASLDFILQGSAELKKKIESIGYVANGDFYEKISESGLPIRISLAQKNNFGSLLLERTGPEDFVHSFGSIELAATEAELFAKKKKDFLPPECRDLGIAPKGLIEEKDIRGVFHLHTKWSDGAHSLEEMVLAAKNLGLEYLGVSEHSRSAVYAHGLDEKRVLEQKKEIERLQKQFDFRIFHGIESDILSEGELDYSADFLKNFDFVIASVHGQMRMNPKDMTKRLVNALKNPATTWLGHWTGRLLLGRAAYEFDHEEVMKAAAGEGKGIELNASPYRLDMDWRELGRAAELKIPLGIFPDAHSTGGLADTKYGVWMARKAGLRASDVVNTKTCAEIEKWLQ
jgi:DNA polymerase (family 10)